jgi:hypothetical protein
MKDAGIVVADSPANLGETLYNLLQDTNSKTSLA